MNTKLLSIYESIKTIPNASIPILESGMLGDKIITRYPNETVVIGHYTFLGSWYWIEKYVNHKLIFECTIEEGKPEIVKLVYEILMLHGKAEEIVNEVIQEQQQEHQQEESSSGSGEVEETPVTEIKPETAEVKENTNE